MKYGNKKTVLDGMTFDSRKEANRYAELRLMEKAGLITNLHRQVPIELLPSQRRNGKIVERPVRYIVDFVYTQDGENVYEDVKGGIRTKEYVIKRKLMLWEFGIQVKEV